MREHLDRCPIVISALIVALAVSPLGAGGTGVRPLAVAVSIGPLPAGVAATVSWDGQDLNAATSAASAIGTTFGGTVILQYHWTSAALVN